MTSKTLNILLEVGALLAILFFTFYGPYALADTLWSKYPDIFLTLAPMKSLQLGLASISAPIFMLALCANRSCVTDLCFGLFLWMPLAIVSWGVSDSGDWLPPILFSFMAMPFLIRTFLGYR